MKWYWYVAIGIAVLAISYFGYDMLKKDEKLVDIPSGSNASAETTGTEDTKGEPTKAAA